MLTPVRAWASRERERGEHDGQVGFDAVADAVEHRPCGEVGLGHPERSLDLVELVVGSHDVRTVHGVGVDVGEVARPGQVAGPFDQIQSTPLTALVILTNRSFFNGRVPATTASARSIILLIARLSCWDRLNRYS